MQTRHYETHRTTTVTAKIESPQRGRPPKAKTPRGMIDILSTKDSGMVLLDACVPVAVAVEMLAYARRAGVVIR